MEEKHSLPSKNSKRRQEKWRASFLKRLMDYTSSRSRIHTSSSFRVSNRLWEMLELWAMIPIVIVMVVLNSNSKNSYRCFSWPRNVHSEDGQTLCKKWGLMKTNTYVKRLSGWSPIRYGYCTAPVFAGFLDWNWLELELEFRIFWIFFISWNSIDRKHGLKKCCKEHFKVRPCAVTKKIPQREWLRQKHHKSRNYVRPYLFRDARNPVRTKDVFDYSTVPVVGSPVVRSAGVHLRRGYCRHRGLEHRT